MARTKRRKPTRRRSRRRSTSRRRNPARRRRRRAPARRRSYRRRNPTRRRRTTSRRRRRRNPRFGKHRPTLRYTKGGWRAGKRSRTFRKKRSVIRRNPGKFSLKRAFSTRAMAEGLKSAAVITGGVIFTGFLKQKVISKLTANLNLGTGGVWVDHAVTIATAGLAAEAARSLGASSKVAELIFVGGVFSVVQSVVKQFAPGELSSYLGGFISLPPRRGVGGFMTSGSRVGSGTAMLAMGGSPISLM